MSQINVNTITGKDGGSAVNFPNGIIVTGVVTATQLNQNVVGVVSATTFDGNLTGNVTGNVTSSGANTLGSLTVSNDATITGNLTVNGTTTTIDTAVTAVDSLAVDGNVTALGNCGIGTNDPSPHGGEYRGIDVAYKGSGITGRTGNPTFTMRSNIYYDGSNWKYGQGSTSAGVLSVGGNQLIFESAPIGTAGATATKTEKFRIDQHGTAKFQGSLTEKCNRDGGAGLTGDYVHHLKTYGNVHWSTNNSSATWTYDITGDGSTNLNDMMTDQETLSFQLISAQNNASYYMTQLKIDGSSSHTVFWQGGSAPTAGGASGYDVYTFTIFKRLNASFRIFGSLTNHA